MATEAIPLSAEDRAILELESETVAGHTCKVLVLDGPAPDLAALRAAIAERITAAPELTRRLGESGADPAWVADPGFDPAVHVVAADPGGPVDRDGLRRVVAELFAQRLDRERPLWRLDHVPLAGGGAALVWRLHHALADGTTAVRLARAVLFDPGDEPAAPSHRPSPAPEGADERRRRRHLARFLEHEFARSRTRSPFDASVGTRREIGFARVALTPLHDAAKALAGATVNDAVLGCVAGGLRRWLESAHGPLGELRAKVPVSLHHAGDAEGNRDSFFVVPLPLGEPDAVERLRAIRAATAARKTDHDAERMDSLLRELERTSPRLERYVERLERSPRRFALNVSNVPGPRAPVSVLGAPLGAMHTIAEIGERHALRAAVISYAGELCFGLCADPEAVHDLDRLAGGIEAEAAELVRLGEG